MRPFTVGDILVSSFLERDGPWRAPTIMFPTAEKATALAHRVGFATDDSLAPAPAQVRRHEPQHRQCPIQAA